MEFETFTPKVVRVLKPKLIPIIAIILMFSGGYDLFVMSTTGDIEGLSPVTTCFMAVAKVCMGLFILFDPRKNLLRAVGFYAFALGLSRLLMSIRYVFNPNDIFFIIGLVFVGMGCNLMWSGYNYLNETSRSRNGMTMTASLLALMQAFTILYYVKILGDNTLETLLSDTIPEIILLFQYLALLLIMDTEELRFGSNLEKANSRAERIRVTYTLESGLMLMREDALTIRHMFDDRSSWSPVDDGGPVELERRIHLVNGRIPACMIMQKWQGSDRIYVTMVNEDDGSIITANRFYVTDVVPDKESDDDFRHLRLYQDGRMLAQIWVMERMDETLEEVSEEERDVETVTGEVEEGGE